MATVEAVIRQLRDSQKQLEGYVQGLFAELQAKQTPHTLTEEIDSIPGRRIFYNLVGVQNFTIANNGVLANPIQFLVSQDGPFVMTHYPMACWKPNAPAGATNFGRWSPMTSWPLPTQQVGANQDSIDISYQLNDAGSQRFFQNLTAPPVLSTPHNMEKLPVPTLFSPNAAIAFIPFYEDINFAAGAATPTTGGSLVVALPGYRIVNL